MTHDAETVRLYDDKAVEYAEDNKSAAKHPSVLAFIAALPTKGRVLDFGCGPGLEASVFADAGFQTDAMDASAEMVRLAAQHTGVTATQATFDQLSARNIYDGIWANFSLLHAPRTDIGHHLSTINKALKPNGIFHIGLKTGSGEKRDPIGRLYTYYTEPELKTLLKDAGFSGFDCHYGASKGLDGVMADWITILTRKTQNA